MKPDFDEDCDEVASLTDRELAWQDWTDASLADRQANSTRLVKLFMLR